MVVNPWLQELPSKLLFAWLYKTLKVIIVFFGNHYRQVNYFSIYIYNYHGNYISRNDI